ncbi:nucleoside diphosphate kinase regulator [Carboxylicivirga taeanensis]|uniref:nucleoside diphosphate kinase regulator n=1 Tax=Carboxylicivirga taeanensis TaxID=1416875 RepID=UPI003F6DBBEB
MKHLIINQNDSARIKRLVADSNNRKKYQTKEIYNLLQEIDKGKCFAPENVPPQVVTMNSIVRIRYMDTGRTVDIQIVYPDQADIKKNKLSIFAPIATALLGYQKGDTIEWEVPKGTITLLIEEILYQPEQAGDFHL